jgi:hypothetical protein
MKAWILPLSNGTAIGGDEGGLGELAAGKAAEVVLCAQSSPADKIPIKHHATGSRHFMGMFIGCYQRIGNREQPD